MTEMDAARFARYIDQTLLSPQTSIAEADAWIAENAHRGFATLCVTPLFVAAASSALAGTDTAVCSVCAFPLGYSKTSVKVEEARKLVADGCAEVDMVVAIGELIGGNDRYVRDDIAQVVTGVGAESAGAAIVKVILETGFLSEEAVTRGCMLAEEAGAHFVKTSTGFGPRGASVRDVELMNTAVGGRLGIKAAGGIRDAGAAIELIEAGATRLGTSSGARLLDEYAAKTD